MNVCSLLDGSTLSSEPCRTLTLVQSTVHVDRCRTDRSTHNAITNIVRCLCVHCRRACALIAALNATVTYALTAVWSTDRVGVRAEPVLGTLASIQHLADIIPITIAAAQHCDLRKVIWTLQTTSTELPAGAVGKLSPAAFYVRGSIPRSRHNF